MLNGSLDFKSKDFEVHKSDVKDLSHQDTWALMTRFLQQMNYLLIKGKMYLCSPGWYKREQEGLSHTSCQVISVITSEYLNWDLCI